MGERSPMSRLKTALAALVVTIGATGTSPALAHTGLEHAFSFASGFAHPWTGPDHILAMVAVGGAQRRTRAVGLACRVRQCDAGRRRARRRRRTGSFRGAGHPGLGHRP